VSGRLPDPLPVAADGQANAIERHVVMQRSGRMAVSNAGIAGGAVVMVVACLMPFMTDDRACQRIGSEMAFFTLAPVLGLAAIAGLRQLLALIPAPSPLPRAVVAGSAARRLRNAAVAAISRLGNDRWLAGLLHVAHCLLSGAVCMLTFGVLLSMVGSARLSHGPTACQARLMMTVGIGLTIVSAAVLGPGVARRLGRDRRGQEGAP
jgi:hypothetical protein